MSAVNIDIDPTRMAASGITVADLRRALLSANLGSPVGDLVSGNQTIAIESGPFLQDAACFRKLHLLLAAMQKLHPQFLFQQDDLLT